MAVEHTKIVAKRTNMLTHSIRVPLSRLSILPSSLLGYGLPSSWANRCCHRTGRCGHPWCSSLFEFSYLEEERRKFFGDQHAAKFFPQPVVKKNHTPILRLTLLVVPSRLSSSLHRPPILEIVRVRFSVSLCGS